jgi:antitoxin component of MazEF toxin-antitoxin module
MRVQKVRKVGNSNVVSVPAAFVRAGYSDGRPVVVERLETGQLLISPVESHREHIKQIARAAATRHRVSLDMLTAYDHGDEDAAPSSSTEAAVPALV